MQSIVEEAAITNQLNEQVEHAADRYFKKYRGHMELLESHSLLSKTRAITPYDFYALGKQLDFSSLLCYN